MSKEQKCPHKTLRNWPDCFEDCDFAGEDGCPHHGKANQLSTAPEDEGMLTQNEINNAAYDMPGCTRKMNSNWLIAIAQRAKSKPIDRAEGRREVVAQIKERAITAKRNSQEIYEALHALKPRDNQAKTRHGGYDSALEDLIGFLESLKGGK